MITPTQRKWASDCTEARNKWLSRDHDIEIVTSSPDAKPKPDDIETALRCRWGKAQATHDNKKGGGRPAP